MRKLCLIAFSLLGAVYAQQAPTHYLLTFQLAPGLDLTRLTAEQQAVFAGHGKHLATLNARGLIVGGRTNETVDTLAVVILAADEATAKAAVADDPATRAGYFKTAVHPFLLLMPPAPAGCRLEPDK